MTITRALLFLLIVSAGCDPNRNSKADENTQANLADQLDGYWLSDHYLTDVETSRSIYESRNYQTRFWGFRLSKENLMSDVAALNGFTEHEGGYGGPLKFDFAKKTFVNDTSRAEELSTVKEPFDLNLIDADHLELDFGDKKERYRKVSNEQMALRKVLFEGKFKDLMHANTTIEFTGDGHIVGLDSVKYFELVFDFGEGINYDVSIFYPNQDSSGIWDKGDLFHFKIKTDTIKLYRITPDWNEMNHTIGGLEYVLVKSAE